MALPIIFPSLGYNLLTLIKAQFLPCLVSISQGDEATAAAADVTLEDAKEIVQGRPYHWKDWCVVRGRDCLYLWSDVAALELSNGSNGWFRFILDGKLATMYSSGSPEGGSDSSGMSCSDFCDLRVIFVSRFCLRMLQRLPASLQVVCSYGN